MKNERYEKYIPTTYFVCDGRRRALNEGTLQQIREHVQQRHATELSAVGFLRRFILKIRIRREIKRELDKITPRDALYYRP